MTGEHDDDSLGFGDIADTDAVLEQLLGGNAPGPHAPAWCGDVALLVRAAQAPPTDDELAGEDDIVQRMLAVRLAAGAPDSGAPAANVELDPPLPSAASTATPGVVTLLGDHRARHTPARAYRAKHAARLEASRHPAVRTLGHVLAMKAAAVTTAMVIGVAAAAAATTGIVATVVVPALSSNEPADPAPPPTTAERSQRDGSVDDPGGRSPASPDRLPLVTCPLLPACVAVEGSAPASATTRPTTSTSITTGTTVADEDVAPSETTTTTAPPTSTTTIAPTATTVPETPTTTTSTTVPEDPGPMTPMSVPDGGVTGTSATGTSSPTPVP